jgi:hypothetical protein
MSGGRIISSTSIKPKVMKGKTFEYVKNPRTKQYVKFRK